MEDTVIEKLCAHLTGTVANKPADEFYQEFNLSSTSYAEYYFKEMKEIFHLPEMEKWPVRRSDLGTKEKDKPPPMFFSMVCFNPPASNLLPNSKRVLIAHSKAREMLYSSFPTTDDHKCIDVALGNFPTIAIFMAQVPDQGLKNKKKKKCAKAYLM
jgi:hypothetical protein